MEEVWRDIKGYEGLYQVSNFGNVRGLDRIDCHGQFRKGKEIKQHIEKISRYKYVAFSKNGITKKYKVHRLVAEAFIPNPENKSQVGHKDESRDNNKADNLEWVTQLENNNMPLRRKRMSVAFTGRTFSDKTKAKMSASQKGKRHTEEWKKKHSEAMFGESNAASDKVICEEVVYMSAAECAREYGIKSGTLRSWLSGRRKMPKEWKDRGLRYA